MNDDGAGDWKPPMFSCMHVCANLSDSSISVQVPKPLVEMESCTYEGSGCIDQLRRFYTCAVQRKRVNLVLQYSRN